VESLELGELGTFIQALNSAAPLFQGDGGQQLYAHLLKQAGLPIPAETALQQASEPRRASEIDDVIDSVLDEAFALAKEVDNA
jgi:hypothetical protein